MGEQQPLRVVIVDDHRLARESIRMALRLFCSRPVEIVGEAADAGTGLELARHSTPNLVTVDIGLPDMSGIELVRRLKAELPGTHIVVVTAESDRSRREEALSAGAAFCLGKDKLVEELPSCLDLLMIENEERMWISNYLVTRLAQVLAV